MPDTIKAIRIWQSTTGTLLGWHPVKPAMVPGRSGEIHWISAIGARGLDKLSAEDCFASEEDAIKAVGRVKPELGAVE